VTLLIIRGFYSGFCPNAAEWGDDPVPIDPLDEARAVST
jgi:hypothetical protein